MYIYIYTDLVSHTHARTQASTHARTHIYIYRVCNIVAYTTDRVLKVKTEDNLSNMWTQQEKLWLDNFSTNSFAPQAGPRIEMSKFG